MKKADKLGWILKYIKNNGPQGVESFTEIYGKECKPGCSYKTCNKELTIYLAALYRLGLLKRERKGNPWHYEYSI